METDCLQLVQLWEKMEFQRSPIGSVLTEIKELSFAFSHFVFKFVSRRCNRVAHLLAKQFTDTHRSEVWHETLALFRRSNGGFSETRLDHQRLK
jgi:hypothetical protein